MTGLVYKSDWLQARERLSAWWRREEVDRPALHLTAPRERAAGGPTLKRPNPSHRGASEAAGDPPHDWLDYERVLARQEACFRRTAFLGEAYPGVEVSLGPGSLGAFLGARCTFTDRTVWYDPRYSSIGRAAIRWDDDHPLWRWTRANTALALNRGRGRWVVDLPDLIENLDTLAALVGTETLLIALAAEPAEVHRLQAELLPAWFKAFDALAAMVGSAQEGNGWLCFKAWAPGRMAKLQCDLSGMISPAMFDEFVMPYLIRQVAGLDHCLYHLDGAEAVKHLKSLLSIEGLDVLQWTPGAGQPHGGDPVWDPIYRAALNAGRGIHASMPIGAVPGFVARLGRRGVYINTEAPSEAEGERLLLTLQG